MTALLRTALLVLALLPFTSGMSLAAEPHKLALQISDNDPDKMNAVLNVAANVSRYYSDKAEEVEIQIVAFNAGLTMLREDNSPVKPRIADGFGHALPVPYYRMIRRYFHRFEL